MTASPNEIATSLPSTTFTTSSLLEDNSISSISNEYSSPMESVNSCLGNVNVYDLVFLI